MSSVPRRLKGFHAETGCPLWQAIKDAKRQNKDVDSDKRGIILLTDLDEDGRMKRFVYKGYQRNYQLVHDVACRMVRDKQMQIDRFHDLYDKFCNRYNASTASSWKDVPGSFVVCSDSRYGFSAVKIFKDDWFYPINTEEPRKSAIKKWSKKIGIEAAETMGMLAEMDYIFNLSKKAEIKWSR